MMSQILISDITTPLPRHIRRLLGQMLADAFAEDTTMLTLLGRRKWLQIAATFFHHQLCFSDLILTASRNNQLVGVVAARSPNCPITLGQALVAPLATRYLLGRAYPTSASLGREIAAQLPDSPHYYINHLGVLPHHTGMGIAGQLLDALHQRVGGVTVFVDCEPDLQTLYFKHGYQVTHHCSAGKLIIMRQDHKQEHVYQNAI